LVKGRKRHIRAFIFLPERAASQDLSAPA